MFNRALGMQDVISFTVGEPDLNTPDNIVEAAITALRNGEHHYTPNAGIMPLRKAISDNTERTHNIKYDPSSQIIVTAGGMEALILAFMTILDPGDEFILADPCWTNYSRQILICKGKPVFIKVTPQFNFGFDPEQLERAITKNTKGFLINSPANPTGGIADEEQLKKLAEIAIKHDLFVITDEVYNCLLYDGKKAFSIAQLPGMAERTIVINSFSKTYAMTGWRVGYAMGPSNIIGNMVKLQENVAACVNSAAQFAAIEALTGSQERLYEMQRIYADRRTILLEEFEKIDKLSCFVPQGTFYAFVDISKTGKNARDFAMDLLEKKRVIVVPGDAFGESGEQYIRLSFATGEENIRNGIRRIGEYVRSI